MGNTNASVLPEPVPVATRRFPASSKLERRAFSWCVYRGNRSMGIPCSIKFERPDGMMRGYSCSRSRRNRAVAKAGVASMKGS